MSEIIRKFFEPVREPAPDEITGDESAIPMADVLTTLSKISSQSTYIIDYTRKGFQYVSPHPLFLCGYSARFYFALKIPLKCKLLIFA